MDDDDEYAIIGCTACSAMPQPEVPSQRTTCYECGAELWISDIVLELAHREHPGMEVRAYCFYTCMPQNEAPITVPREQREYLRQHHSLSDDQIDDLIAISEVLRRRE